MYPDKSMLSTDLDWMMQSHQVSDAQLLQALFSEFDPWLYRLAFFLTGETAKARVAVENTLIKAVSNRRRFWGSTTLRAWVAALTLKQCRELSHRNIVLAKLAFLQNRTSGSIPMKLVVSPDRLPVEYQALGRRIVALSPQEIMTLLLRYVQGLNAAELAYVQKMSESSILTRLRELREQLGNRALYLQEVEARKKTQEGRGFQGHSAYFQLIHKALDQSLKEEDQHHLQQHFGACLECRTYSAKLAEIDHRLGQSIRACWPEPVPSGGDAQTLIAALGQNVGKTHHQRNFTRLAKEFILVVVPILVVIALSSAGKLTAAGPSPTPPSANTMIEEVFSLIEASPDVDTTPAASTTNYRPRWRPDYPGVHESILGSLNSESPSARILNFPNRRDHLSPARAMPDINMSGPVNLHLLLHYWGERGNPEPYLQPNSQDETVMFYEMVDYVEERTGLEALMRMAGDINTIKALIDAGIPVLVQKGYDSPQPDGWAGHYVIVNGFDDLAGSLSLLAAFPEDGEDTPMPYTEFEQAWRAFNFAYLLVYSPDREDYVRDILGSQIDEVNNYQYAADRASAEIESLAAGRELFFAWFNLGTSLTYLEDYSGAKEAFEKAFSLYATLPEEERPWRILWYQTRPYWAFFYSGSYQVVIDLANSILNTSHMPHLEESYYWRALAKEALGDLEGAIQDLNESIRLNPNFIAGKYQLRRIKGET